MEWGVAEVEITHKTKNILNGNVFKDQCSVETVTPGHITQILRGSGISLYDSFPKDWLKQNLAPGIEKAVMPDKY